MEGIWIVFVIIGWIISAVSKANKKQQEQAKKAAQARPVSRAQAAPAPAITREWKDGRFTDAKPARANTAPAKPTAPKPLQTIQPTAHSEPHETHMHTPEMGQEGAGTEGIDCCHEYMLGGQEAAEGLDILGLKEEEPEDRAQALLQGVIFSEILGRRPVKHYGRRSA